MKRGSLLGCKVVKTLFQHLRNHQSGTEFGDFLDKFLDLILLEQHLHGHHRAKVGVLYAAGILRKDIVDLTVEGIILSRLSKVQVVISLRFAASTAIFAPWE